MNRKVGRVAPRAPTITTERTDCLSPSSSAVVVQANALVPNRGARGATRPTQRSIRTPMGAVTPTPLAVSRTASLILTALLGLTLNAFAQVQVRTLGGGRTTPAGADYGYVDGNTLQESQFNRPSGVAVDLAGNVFIADRENGALRKLDVSRNRASTLVAGLNQPVAVAVDSTNNLYVLTQGDGRIRRIDRFGNLSTNQTRLTSPTALALDRNNVIYATESGGTVVRIDPITEARTAIKDGLRRPSGIAVLDSGLLAVSDTDSHRVIVLDPNSRAIVLQAGTGTAGFRDGSLGNAQFDQPHQLARAPDGTLVVADRMNHRVRLIRPGGAVTTLYGVDPKAWEGPECLTCDPVILPGWFDGDAEFAEAREPVGVAVGKDGKIYTTELYYHLIREVTGGGVAAQPGGGGADTNLVVLPPIITPDSGYFPLGQDITVINPNTNSFFSNAVFYTTDGTEPTTNSFRLALTDNTGTLRWRETLRDLTSLRVLAFVGSRASEVVRGKPAATNSIGITRDLAAGPGSTIIVPISVNLRPQDQLKSLQFRVDVRPAPGVLAIPVQFRALSVSTNDFIPVATSSEASGVATFTAAAYTNDSARGLAISFIGRNSGLSVKNFATVAMLAVPVPAEAKAGDQYTLEVSFPSGTSDGAEDRVELAPMAPRPIYVVTTGFEPGNSSPADWYDAASIEDWVAGHPPVFGPYRFGDGRIDNSDVNNVFIASLGLRVPYPFSSLFAAMDVFPEDTLSAPGGDGLIRFLDWQLVLQRSLGLDFGQWIRTWTANGLRVEAVSDRSAAAPNLPATALQGMVPVPAWIRHVVVSATPQEDVVPGVKTDIPLYLTVAAGYRVAGLAFRATLHSDGGAPPLTEPAQFIPALGMPKPNQTSGNSPNDLLCGWPMVPTHSFAPPLQGKTLLGHIRVTLPVGARPGQTYALRFSNADGSPDLQTQYDFETRPATVWVQSAALQKTELISDEWKMHFFRSLTSDSAKPDADPDQDGISNRDEYLAGTNPNLASSKLRLEAGLFDATKTRITFRWAGTLGRSYTIEASSSLLQPEWKLVVRGLPGTGAMQEFVQTDAPPGTQFYRLRVQTQDAMD